MTRHRSRSTPDEICERRGIAPDPPAPGTKAGGSRNIGSDVDPLIGVRHPIAGGVSGWYLWRGENLSADPDFFVSVHIEHLAGICPQAVPFLCLPPGWRFLIAAGHEEVWAAPSLLTV